MTKGRSKARPRDFAVGCGTTALILALAVAYCSGDERAVLKAPVAPARLIDANDYGRHVDVVLDVGRVTDDADLLAVVSDAIKRGAASPAYQKASDADIVTFVLRACDASGGDCQSFARLDGAIGDLRGSPTNWAAYRDVSYWAVWPELTVKRQCDQPDMPIAKTELCLARHFEG